MSEVARQRAGGPDPRPRQTTSLVNGFVSVHINLKAPFSRPGHLLLSWIFTGLQGAATWSV